MSNASRLTSRNLFDDVFATIPADVFLYYGPESLQEKYALMTIRRTKTEVAKEANKQTTGDAQDDGLLFVSSSAPSHTGVMDVSAKMRNVGKENEERNGPMTKTSFRDGLDIQFDPEDEAVQEATKYAALFSHLDEEETGDFGEGGGDEKKPKEEGGVEEGDGEKGADDKNKSSRAASRRQHPQQQSGDALPMSGRHALSAEEQVTVMQPEQATRHNGRCVLFRHNKGFGFLTPDVGGPDVYFTRDNIEYYFTRRVLELYQRDVCLDAQEANNGDEEKQGGGGGAVLGGVDPATTNATGVEDNADDGKAKVASNDGDGADNAQATRDGGSEVDTTASNLEDETDAATEDLIRQAAALLTPETARLLLLFLRSGKPSVSVPETVTFRTRWNRTANRAGRRLRADAIRGLRSNGYALLIEQAWFERVFSRSSGRGSEKANNATQCGSEVCLPRYCGTVRAYDADELRGAIRPDEGNMQNIFFYGDSVLWDPLMDPARCRLAVGLMVRFSIAGRDRHGKYIATLITATDDTAISDANAKWAVMGDSAEDCDERKLNDGGVRVGSGGVRGDSRDEEMKGVKRGRDEELLLLEEDGYGVI